jgi:aryl-alcohol dehydrogenase-like predicted oxidoreductase
VACVIPGIRSLEHLRGNLDATRCSIDADHRRRLETFWEDFTHGGEDLLPW